MKNNTCKENRVSLGKAYSV